MARESIIGEIQGLEAGRIPNMRLDQAEGPAYVMDVVGCGSFWLNERTEFRARRIIGMPWGVQTKPNLEQVSWKERKFTIRDLWSLEGKVNCVGLIQEAGEQPMYPDVRIGLATASDQDFGPENAAFLLNQIKVGSDWILSRIELVYHRSRHGGGASFLAEQKTVDKADKIGRLLLESIYGSQPKISRSFI